MDTIIPVFNKVSFLLSNFLVSLNFFSTNKSQNIIIIIPTIIPIITFIILLIPNASGIKSKHITAIIKPDANAKIKLKNLLEFFFITTPMIPPKVVPNVPKNNPKSVVFKISFTIKSP